MNEYEYTRPITVEERSILDLLLSATFPGSDQLVKQLSKVMVTREYTSDGKLITLTVNDPQDVKAEVSWRIPIEAHGKDKDGMAIFVLLHVHDGLLSELEAYRGDGQPLTTWPEPSSLTIVNYWAAT